MVEVERQISSGGGYPVVEGEGGHAYPFRPVGLIGLGECP